MLLRHRIQEWAAERFDWVQYPDIRDARNRPSLGFKTQMPWEKRVGLALFGVFALGFGGALLIIVGVLVYCLI